MNPATRKSRNGDRGIALITTLLMISVFLILIGTLMSSMANDLVLTGVHGQSNSALRAAYAGIEYTTYQFEENDSGRAPGVVPANPQQGSFTDDTGNVVTWSVNIDAIRWSGSALPYYLLHATGSSGTSSRTLDALIQKLPFSAYNLFTISEQNNHGNTVWYAQGEEFNGPVYSGGPMRIDYTSGSSPAIFGSTVTTAASPVWAPNAPSSGADWNAVMATGSSNFVQVGTPMTLPTATDNSAVQNAAFTGNPSPSTPPTFPSTVGMYINGTTVVGGSGNLNTGIYIVGQTAIATTVRSAATATTDTLTFNVPGAGIYVVTIDTTANTTTVKNASGTVLGQYNGVPVGQQAPGTSGADGAIWINGQASFFNGNVYHGDYTFAVPDAQGSSNPPMYFFGSQTYQNPANDKLAFWANDMILNVAPAVGNVVIDGLLLTGYYGECSVVCTDGTLYNEWCPAGSAKCTQDQGTLTLLGSLIENVRGKRGTSGSTTSGFTTISNFDSRLARNPPPFTPMTVAYSIIALCTTDSGTTCGQ